MCTKMIVHVIIFLCFITSTINGEQYDTRGTLIYEDLSCKPIKLQPNDPLPTSYDCNEAFDNPCFYQDKNYQLNEVMPWQLSLQSCSSSCRCKSEGFTCAMLRCPEIGLVTLSKPDCYHIYSLNECCNSGEICPPFDEVPRCEVDGKMYMKGQKFYPNNTNLHCICTEEFNGKFESAYCRKIACGLSMKNRDEINKRCAPFYSDTNKRQCPTSWICPSDEFKDEIKVSNKQKPRGSCIYGDKQLQMGDYFDRKELDYINRADRIVRCACKVPPLLTCLTKNLKPWN